MTTTKNARNRGRPTKIDRDEATSIAMKLFWERGYDAVGVAELADAAGVKPPSLYGAFGNKLGLLEAAVNLYSEGEGRFVVDCASKAATARELIADVLLSAAEAYSSKPTTRGCLVLDGARNSADPEARKLLQTLRASTSDFLTSQFERVGSNNPRELADYVLIAMTGLSGSARDGADRDVLLRSAARFASIDSD